MFVSLTTTCSSAVPVLLSSASRILSSAVPSVVSSGVPDSTICSASESSAWYVSPLASSAPLISPVEPGGSGGGVPSSPPSPLGPVPGPEPGPELGPGVGFPEFPAVGPAEGVYLITSGYRLFIDSKYFYVCFCFSSSEISILLVSFCLLVLTTKDLLYNSLSLSMNKLPCLARVKAVYNSDAILSGSEN
jgi:hypothetical protein